MSPSHKKGMRTTRRSAWVIGLLLATLITMTTWAQLEGRQTLGRLINQRQTAPWFTLDEQDVEIGATIPANTHVSFKLPFGFDVIARDILLGQKGKKARYWGYCFPENFDPSVVSTRVGFPGLMFLSERERAVRAQAAAATAPKFSLFKLPSKADLVSASERKTTAIRHQLELFREGMLCYIMSESSLSIGLDADEDGLNKKLETEIGTDPDNADTEGDGVDDGTEYIQGTNPSVRDTDADGVIDGIEDRNWNGKIDPGETDPRTKDTDRDGLCDGYCRMRLSDGQQIFAGEDKNLNGEVDSGETNPLKMDSKNDGYSDYQRFIQCLLRGNEDC